jgi:membrane fusion protein (multidrug efflux system)
MAKRTKKYETPHWTWILVLFGVAVFQNGCQESAGRAPPQNGPQKNQAAPVQVEQMDLRPYRPEVTAVATLEAWRKVTLRAEAPGRVRRLGPNVGERVSQGRLLVQIDSATAWRAYKTSRVRIQQARVQLDLAKKTFARMKQLRSTGDVSQAQYDQALNAQQAARAALALARAQTAQSRQSLSQYRITAPFDGVLSRRDVELGDYLSPGAATYTLVEMHRLKLVVGLAPQAAAQLQPGDRAWVHLAGEAAATADAGASAPPQTDAARPKTRCPARVHLVRPVANETTRRVEVELVVPNPERTLKPGTVARVRIPLGKTQRKLLVPLDAVVERMGKKYVYLVQNGRAQRVRVVLGISQRNRVEIRLPSAPTENSGGRKSIRPGALLVVDGVERVVAGKPVVFAQAVENTAFEVKKSLPAPEKEAPGKNTSEKAVTAGGKTPSPSEKTPSAAQHQTSQTADHPRSR